MTDLDEVIAELGVSVTALSTRAAAALFATCSLALLPAFRTWAAHRHASTESVLQLALSAADEFAVFGVLPLDVERLLQALEAATPAGDSPDHISSTLAQDCWICADVSIRVLVDTEYDPGPAIEYALEPVLSAVTHRLFGVSQIGSGPDEQMKVHAILADPAARTALEFCRWAIDYLRVRASPSENDLDLIRSRSEALLPEEMPWR